MKLVTLQNKPRFLLSLFSFIGLSLAMVLVSYIYDKESQKLLYEQVSDQLSAINKLKEHELKFFFKYRKADIQALASTEAVLYLSQSKHHPYFKQFLKEYMYKDIIIVDNENGHILFSVNNEKYIGKNLHSNEFKNSKMTKVYKDVLNTKTTHFSDMHVPVLNSDEPVMLIATPIIKNNQITSVLMLKLSSTAVNEVLHFKASSINSLETYAVGEDYLLRSDSFLVKEMTVKSSFSNPENYFVKTKNVDKALKGQSGVSIIKDYRDVDVLSAYCFFEFDSTKWAILSEIDEVDITKELKVKKKTFYTWAFFVSIFMFIMGYFIIKRIIDVSVVNPLVSLYEKAKGFEDIINNSLNEIYVFSKDELFFMFANDTALNNSGFTLEEIKKMKPYELEAVPDEKNFLELVTPLLTGEKALQKFETLNRRKNGTLYNVHVNLQLMEVEGVEKFVAIVNDITEYKKVIEEKKHYYDLSTHDHLTKIFNRQMFDELFKIEVEQSRRYNSDMSLILIDIDFFKTINDNFGHQSGDNVLKIISANVKTLLRDSDIFARWGGEEFVILMPHADISMAAEKAEQLRKSIENLNIDTVGSVTCSFGVAQFKNFENANELFTHADEALYKSKHNGRNRVETAD